MAPKKRSAKQGIIYMNAIVSKSRRRGPGRQHVRAQRKLMHAAARIRDAASENSASGRGRLFASGYAAGTETDKRRRGKSTAEQKFPHDHSKRTIQKRIGQAENRKTNKTAGDGKAAGIGKTETGKYQI